MSTTMDMLSIILVIGSIHYLHFKFSIYLNMLFFFITTATAVADHNQLCGTASTLQRKAKAVKLRPATK